jgi:hypothetical protein
MINLLILAGSVVAQVNFSKTVIDTSFAENSHPWDIKASDIIALVLNDQ